MTPSSYPLVVKGLARMPEFSILSEKIKERFVRAMAPFCNFLSGLGVSPNALSLVGLSLSVVAGLIYASGSFFCAGAVLILAGTCECAGRPDGQVDRENDLVWGFFGQRHRPVQRAVRFLGLAWYFSRLPGKKSRIVFWVHSGFNHNIGLGRFLHGQLHPRPCRRVWASIAKSGGCKGPNASP